MNQVGWEHFVHQADIGVRGFGSSLEEAFEQAALALIAVICRLDAIEAKTEFQFHCSGTDPELLFVDWLNLLIYEISTRHVLFNRFQVEIDGQQLDARVWGEPLIPAKHRPAVEIKGATFTELAVRQENGVWIAQCVVDV
jgi:SHS2 domain-containing protein